MSSLITPQPPAITLTPPTSAAALAQVSRPIMASPALTRQAAAPSRDGQRAGEGPMLPGQEPNSPARADVNRRRGRTLDVMI
jgi:hypothetical protein